MERWLLILPFAQQICHLEVGVAWTLQGCHFEGEVLCSFLFVNGSLVQVKPETVARQMAQAQGAPVSGCGGFGSVIRTWDRPWACWSGDPGEKVPSFLRS